MFFKNTARSEEESRVFFTFLKKIHENTQVDALIVRQMPFFFSRIFKTQLKKQVFKKTALIRNDLTIVRPSWHLNHVVVDL